MVGQRHLPHDLGGFCLIMLSLSKPPAVNLVLKAEALLFSPRFIPHNSTIHHCQHNARACCLELLLLLLLLQELLQADAHGLQRGVVPV